MILMVERWSSMAIALQAFTAFLELKGHEHTTHVKQS